ncbi:MAG TPA: hypothetical protein VM942_10565 [Acidimicrobiales bacterium]|nr:hypothetical protein [Acidimicrobiales bacterium]
MTKQQKLVPVFVIVLLLAAVGYTLVPYRFADAIDCEAPLYGGDPKDARGPVEGLIRPFEDCPAKGRSRLTVAAFAALIFSAAGVALVGLKPTSAACLAGSHGDCREWWAAFMGASGEAFSCQCSCHRGGSGTTNWSAGST